MGVSNNDLHDALALLNQTEHYGGRSPTWKLNALWTPLCLGQYKLFKTDGKPTGFVSWALVSPEVKSRLEAGSPIEVADWNSGDVLWFADAVMPCGRVISMVKEIARLFPKGTVGHGFRNYAGRRPNRLERYVAT